MWLCVWFGNKRLVFLYTMEQYSLAPLRALRQPVCIKILFQNCSALPACLPVLAISRQLLNCSAQLWPLCCESQQLSTFCKYSCSTCSLSQKMLQSSPHDLEKEKNQPVVLFYLFFCVFSCLLLPSFSWILL